jgi:hypothetical protein
LSLGEVTVPVDRTTFTKARVSLELLRHPELGGAGVNGDLKKFFRQRDAWTPLPPSEALTALGDAAPADRLRVQLLQADAMLDVLFPPAADRMALDDDPRLPEVLKETARSLMSPDVADELRDNPTPVVEAFGVASREPTRAEQWARLEAQARELLPHTLYDAPHPTCVGKMAPLPNQPNEFAADISTEFVLPYGGRTIDDLADRLVPAAWPGCNRFFCSLTYQGNMEPRAARELSPADADWRGVYEERVGRCPQGSLENVFLDVRWARRPDLVTLTYDLVPGHDSDVEIDKGFVTIVGEADGFRVATGKLLRFSPASGWSDGHSLGLLACGMGWLDTVVDMVVCERPAVARAQEAVPGRLGVGGAAPAIDLTACADHAREAVDRYSAQWAEMAKACREGDAKPVDVLAFCAGTGIELVGDAVRGAEEAMMAVTEIFKR